MQPLVDFIAGAHAAGRQVVMLARSGIVARGPLLTVPQTAIQNMTAADITGVIDHALATALVGEGISVVAVGASRCPPGKVDPNIFLLPHLEADFSDIFPKADLVLHHGRSCVFNSDVVVRQD